MADDHAGFAGAVAAAQPAARASLFTTPFLAICAIGLLAFSSGFVIQPVLPILILERGGDATLVGIVIAAFSFPSVIMRPVMGRLVDEWSHRRVLGFGTGVIGLSGFGYLAPSLGVIFMVRVVHGMAWAAFNTAANATMAWLAPAARRGEASGLYNLTPGLAQMAMPAIGLLLLGAFGMTGPFVASGLLGLAAFAVLTFGPLPKAQRAASSGGTRGLLERGAVLPMTLEFLFTAVSALFLVYPPVFAALHRIPVAELSMYYVVYGVVLVGVRLGAGRLIDRASRGAVIAGGAVVAIAALAVAAAADSAASLTVAGALYAAAAAVTSPTAMAMAIDRAHPGRMGAAMATYSLGFQFAVGLGAATWGFLIDRIGYPGPYYVAIAVEACLVGLVAVTAWNGHRRRTGETP